MAKKTPIPRETNQARGMTFLWTDLQAGDTIDSVDTGDLQGLTFEVSGELGGAMVLIEGSVNGQFYPLTDRVGMPLSFYAEGIKSTPDLVMSAVPRIQGGDASTKITVALLARK